MNPVDAGHHNRSSGDEQLDDGIADTFVSPLLPITACHKGCRASPPGQMRKSLIKSPEQWGVFRQSGARVGLTHVERYANRVHCRR